MSFKYKKDSNRKLFGESYNEEETLEDGELYYDYDEEIKDESEEELEAELEEEELGEKEEKGVDLSFACEDCDYRWDDYIVGEKEDIENEEYDIVCPMCGSLNVSQI